MKINYDKWVNFCRQMCLANRVKKSLYRKNCHHGYPVNAARRTDNYRAVIIYVFRTCTGINHCISTALSQNTHSAQTGGVDIH